MFLMTKQIGGLRQAEIRYLSDMELDSKVNRTTWHHMTISLEHITK